MLESGENRKKTNSLVFVEQPNQKVRAKRKKRTNDANKTSGQEDVEVRVGKSEPRSCTDRGTVSDRQ